MTGVSAEPLRTGQDVLQAYLNYLAKPVPLNIEEARVQAYAIPLEEIDPSHPALFQADTVLPYFERLRADDPVHFCESEVHGPFWSITKFEDIVAVDLDHQNFSSDLSHGGVIIGTRDQDSTIPMFIASDNPHHQTLRTAFSPAFSPSNIAKLSPLIRKRASAILDALPIGVEFDWVKDVSRDLTAMTLATLLGFPYQERHKLTFWSDLIFAVPGQGLVDTLDEKKRQVQNCFLELFDLWNERLLTGGEADLVSMLARSEVGRSLPPNEVLGNLALMLFAGNDTTRNTISGTVVALNEHPDQYALLRDEPNLVPSLISESIRWQTPLAHMRRTAVVDVELKGKHIRKGDQVVMWYLSGNRDADAFDNANCFNLHRDRPRSHLSFGYGIHRCLGNRLAELQIGIIWEEILLRFDGIELVGPPKRTLSNFVRGYESLPVRIATRR